jgi:glycoside/pentoside/hexuronide:cation symporter, GPH family
LGQQLGLLVRNDQWMVLFWVCLIGTVGYVIRGSVALYYAKYYLGGDAKMQAAFVTTGIVGNILSMVASTWITKKFCKIQLFRWSQLITFVLSVAMYFAVGRSNVYLAFALFFLINFIVDLQGPVFWSIISEAVDYGEIKSGRRVAGMAFGGISFAQKMGMSLAAWMVGSLLVHYQYVADKVYVSGNAQDAFTLNGLALMLTVIPGVFHLGMGLLMYKYWITDAKYNEIKEQLTAQGKLLMSGASSAKPE